MRIPRIVSAVTIGSPADFTKVHNQAFWTLLHFRELLKYLPVSPLPFMARLVIPIAHLDFFRLYGGSVYPEHCSRGREKSGGAGNQMVTSNAIWLNFGRFLASGLFASESGSQYLENLPKSVVPVFVVGGVWVEGSDGTARLC